MNGVGILTTDDVCLAVREAGFALGPEDISLDPRDERLAVALPGGYMAWFPTNADGSARLKIERKVCTFWLIDAGSPRRRLSTSRLPASTSALPFQAYTSHGICIGGSSTIPYWRVGSAFPSAKFWRSSTHGFQKSTLPTGCHVGSPGQTHATGFATAFPTWSRIGNCCATLKRSSKCTRG